MKQAKVRRHTVGFFEHDAEVPFINLSMFETIEDATGIPHYWRDADGKYRSSGMLASYRRVRALCVPIATGMKHTFWVVTDPESELVGKMFIVGIPSRTAKKMSSRSLNTRTFHQRSSILSCQKSPDILLTTFLLTNLLPMLYYIGNQGGPQWPISRKTTS